MKSEGYALWWSARYQDCHEEGGRCFGTKAEALAYMEKLSTDPSAIMDFALFELGPRVPFKATRVVEEEVTKRERTKFE